MSATGRTQGLRTPCDFGYNTPPWAVDRILEAIWLPTRKHAVLPAYWLDPCAGNGQLIRAVNAHLVSVANIRWHAVELRPECEGILHTVANPVIIGDFLKVVPARYDVVLTNPPYSLAEEFVRACLPISEHVVMLLRLNWLENRAKLLNAWPADVHVLPNRPAFARNKHGKVGTDATAYAWFHFHKDAAGVVKHLAHTPLEARRTYTAWLEENLPK